MHAHTGCFACALESGVQIYDVDPLTEKGRIGKCSMLIDGLHQPLLTVEGHSKFICTTELIIHTISPIDPFLDAFRVFNNWRSK